MVYRCISLSWMNVIEVLRAPHPPTLGPPKSVMAGRLFPFNSLIEQNCCHLPLPRHLTEALARDSQIKISTRETLH